MHGNGPSAEAENAVLRGQLQGLEARLTRVDQALERVMANDAKIRQPDITRAREILDWEPSSGLRAGIMPTYNYFKSVLEEQKGR